jgi:Holliday junction resolvase
MATTPEKKVKEKVVKKLKSLGAYYFYPVANGFGRSGVPDIVACYNGRFIGIEVKYDASKNPPTELQKYNLAQIDDADGIALVIDRHNVDELLSILEELL